MKNDPKHCGNSTNLGGTYICKLALYPCERVSPCALTAHEKFVDFFVKLSEEKEGTKMKKIIRNELYSNVPYSDILADYKRIYHYGTWDIPWESMGKWLRKEIDIEDLGEFEKYLIRYDNPTTINGIQYIFKFKNGYGASIVLNSISYGREDNLYELAVLCDFNHHPNSYRNFIYELCYDTEITDDVIGWLTWDDVLELLREIRSLPERRG